MGEGLLRTISILVVVFTLGCTSPLILGPTGIILPEESAVIVMCQVGDCANTLISLIKTANETIDFAIYSFSRDDIANSLKDKQLQGLYIRGIFDNAQSGHDWSKDDFLWGYGVQIAHKSASGLMHHKFIIIDKKIICTGSYNWSQNAEDRNDENLICFNSPDIAAAYQLEFDRMWIKYTLNVIGPLV